MYVKGALIASKNLSNLGDKKFWVGTLSLITSKTKLFTLYISWYELSIHNCMLSFGLPGHLTLPLV